MIRVVWRYNVWHCLHKLYLCHEHYRIFWHWRREGSEKTMYYRWLLWGIMPKIGMSLISRATILYSHKHVRLLKASYFCVQYGRFFYPVISLDSKMMLYIKQFCMMDDARFMSIINIAGINFMGNINVSSSHVWCNTNDKILF